MARVTAKKLGEVSAEQTIATYTYEPRSGQTATITDALAQVSTYGYAADGRVASITYTGEQQTTPDVTFAYDPDYPRLSSVTATGLPSLIYGYVPINSSDTVYGDGNVASITGYFGDVMTYTYDELDRRLTRTLQGVSTSTYDALGRVSGWSNPLGSFTPVYLTATNGAPTPRLDYVNYPNGMQIDFDWYDNVGDRRLKEIHNKASGGATINKHGYTYDAAGMIKDWTQQKGANPASRWELGPDNADQLVWLDVKDAVSGVLQKSYDYVYDLAGNRTTEKIDETTTPTTWTVNGLNQLTSQTNPARTFTYDANGAMATNGAGQTYSWDAAGRLAKITYTSTGQTSEFGYDGLGRRVKIIEKSSAGAITSEKRFVWEGMEIVQERDGSNALTRRYFPEGHIGVTDYDGTNGYFYTRDHLGSVRDIIGPYTYTTQYAFDPYGRRTASGYPQFSTDFGYTGHYHHGPSGLTLAPYRAYDAGLGRWLSRDPIGEDGGLNLYGYVFNDPVNGIDPDGLDAILLNNTSSAATAGHAATLVGNDATGWVYYSKNGGAEGSTDNTRTPFSTLAEFQKSGTGTDYNRAVQVPTTPAQDALMQKYGDKNYNLPYHVKGQNCADLSANVFKAGGVPMFTPPKAFFGGYTVPNLLYDEFRQANPRGEVVPAHKK